MKSKDEKSLNTQSLEDKPLNMRQEKFAQLVAKTLHPTDAVRAVYKPKNDSTARSMASENLAKPYIRKRVNQLLSTDRQDKEVMNSALTAQRPPNIEWSDLYRFLELTQRLKGRLNNNNSQQVNIGIKLDNA